MFRLILFGGASIDGPDGPLAGRAVQRRRLALLALLAAARPRGLSRDKLIAFLWPDSDTERARHLLSDSIYRINQAVGGDAISAAGDELRLDPAVLPCDVAEFTTALEEADWERAVGLSTGPFLDGFFLTGALEFERWVDQERDRLARERALALETLARDAAATDAAAAVRWWRMLAADDPFSSRIALALMHALERAGDRVAAFRHARIHGELVRSEHGVEPDREVLAFEERLRSTPPAPPPVPRPAPAKPVRPPATQRASEPVAATMPDSVPSRQTRRRRALPALALGVGALLVAALWLDRQGGDAAAGDATAIAVLPFRDLSAAGDEAYFADGITEELMVRLARVEGLRMVGRTSSFALRDADAREIAERLGVGVILEGSVRRSGDRLRIVAQLVNAADGFEMWSETYERRLDDVFAIQDEIARAIVVRLRGRLAGSGATGPAAAPDVADPEAYNLYLRGRYEWHGRTEQSLRASAEFFRSAVARAPGFARAHAGLADALAVLGFYDYLPPTEAFPSAAASALRALELDPTLASAHATLGYVALYHEWDFDRAESEFQRAIELDPGYSTGHQWYGNLLTALGRFDEAVRAMRTAQDLDPLSRIANAALGWILFHAGDFEGAREQLDRTLELDPDFELARLWRGKALIELARDDEALAELRVVVQSSGGSAISVAALAAAAARAGLPDTARSLLDDLAARAGYLPHYEIATVHLALGDSASALQWLRLGLDARSHSMVFLAVDPQLRGLRTHPDFRALMREVGLPTGLSASEDPPHDGHNQPNAPAVSSA